MKIFSAAQIRKWDDYTIRHEPVSSINLMERAGMLCCNWITGNVEKDLPYIIFCGTGNNGGDGVAIARMLVAAKKKVKVFILEGEKRSADFNTNFARLQPILHEVKFISSGNLPVIDNETIIIDSLYGTGLNRPLEGLAVELILHINQSAGIVVSIDIPSGLFADKCSIGNVIIKATHTLSFETHKLAFMMSENGSTIGSVHLLNIGLHLDYLNTTPTPFYSLDQSEISKVYKTRNQFSHKYNFGHTLLYAGSKNMMGAAILCAKACLRTGAGLVTLHAEDLTQGIIQSALPEAITSTENDWKILSIKKAAIAIGPGLEKSTANKILLKEIIKGFVGGVVIDATALHLLAEDTNVLNNRNTRPVILTPHTGEFEKLFGKTNNDFERMQVCLQKSTALNCYIILKGHHTLIACPGGDAFFNTNGNAGMATAGSGDVLTGIVTSLLAQGYTEKESCIFGVYLHGLAGDIAAKKMSQEAMIASDIIECLGEAFQLIATFPKEK